MRRAFDQFVDLLRGDSAHLNAFTTAMLAGNDSNSRERHFQTLRQQPAQSLVGTVVHGRRRQTNLQCPLPLAFDGVAARPRHDSHCERDCFFSLHEFNHAGGRSCGLPRPEQGGAEANLCGTFFDSHLEVVRHPHGQLRKERFLRSRPALAARGWRSGLETRRGGRSEEHTSELQSRLHLVCRLLLEKKKKKERTKRTSAVTIK